MANKSRNYFGDTFVNGMIILKWITNKYILTWNLVSCLKRKPNGLRMFENSVLRRMFVRNELYNLCNYRGHQLLLEWLSKRQWDGCVTYIVWKRVRHSKVEGIGQSENIAITIDLWINVRSEILDWIYTPRGIIMADCYEYGNRTSCSRNGREFLK